MSNRTKGILSLVIAAVFLSLSLTLIRLAGDLPSTQKMFFRNLVMAMGTFAFMRQQHIPVRIEKRYAIQVLLRGLTGGLSMICNFYAIDRLNLADSAMLNKLAPFFTVVFSWLILGEKARLSGIVALVVAFTGALFIIKPSGSNMALIPACVGAMGGILAGLSYTMVRASSQAGADQKLIVLGLSVISCVMVLPIVIVDFVPMTTEQILCLVACGIVSIFGHFCNTRAYAIAPASEISVFDYSYVVFSAVYGFLLFGQIPDLMSVVGYVVIFGTGLWVFFNNRKHAEAETN